MLYVPLLICARDCELVRVFALVVWIVRVVYGIFVRELARELYVVFNVGTTLLKPILPMALRW